jgi:pimeloyl-ACP methyl ester carboxylesterase
MPQKTVLLLHGFASSAGGTKAQYLREQFAALPHVAFRAFDFNPTHRDFEYMTVTGMINRLRQYILDHHLQDLHVIGSSMGALVGLHYANRFGGVINMLLLAPALSYLTGRLAEEELERWKKAGTAPVLHYAFERELPLRYDLEADGLNYLKPVPPPAPLLIIHGQHDDVIPIGHSRDYAARFPHQVQLIEVDSDHRLNDRLAFIWEHVGSFFETTADR